MVFMLFNYNNVCDSPVWTQITHLQIIFINHVQRYLHCTIANVRFDFPAGEVNPILKDCSDAVQKAQQNHNHTQI